MSGSGAATSPLTIAVVKPCCIGDCVMALPAIESLARAFPLAHIHAFTGRHSVPVFRASPHVSRVYVSPDQMTPARVPGLAWNLRTAGHDWIVVLDRSRLMKTAAQAANPERLVTIPKASNTLRHETDIYLDTVAAAGVEPVTTVPSITPGDEAREAASAALSAVTTPFAVLHPGGAENPGTTMTEKRWPPERYAAVIDHLAGSGISAVLTGGPNDVDLCRQVSNMASAPVTSVAGRLDLMGTTAVIEKAVLYVGTDTGVSHLAAATGTPSVVIFGPTNPERYAPRGRAVEILAPEASRRLPDTDLRKAQRSNHSPRTAEIAVEDVIHAIDRLLPAASAGS